MRVFIFCKQKPDICTGPLVGLAITLQSWPIWRKGTTFGWTSCQHDVSFFGQAYLDLSFAFLDIWIDYLKIHGMIHSYSLHQFPHSNMWHSFRFAFGKDPFSLSEMYATHRIVLFPLCSILCYNPLSNDDLCFDMFLHNLIYILPMVTIQIALQLSKQTTQ